MKVNLYKIKDEKIPLSDNECQAFKLPQERIDSLRDKRSKKVKMQAIEIFLHDLKLRGFSYSEELKRVFKRKNFKLQFFLYDKLNENYPEWKWIADNFSKTEIKNISNPKAILLVTYRKKHFVYTFGTSYFLADQYCDREMAFDFARKIEYKDIKMISKVAPYSKNNKTINAFTSSEVLIFDSGEAFTKIKGKAKLDKDFNVYKEDIEIGTSIKFSLFENSIENLLNIIVFVQEVLTNSNDKTSIPLLKKVTTRENVLLSKLNKRLTEAIKKGNINISFSEFEIKGTTEYFYSSPERFKIKSGSSCLLLDSLDVSEIKKFILNNKITDDKILNITVLAEKDGNEETFKLLELIDYSDDADKCVLISGKWYKFNQDYQTYLENSLNEIEVLYDPQFNYSKSQHDNYLNDILTKEKGLPENSHISEQELKVNLKRKFYRERYYNNNISEKDKRYVNYDRGIDDTGFGKVEIADLYFNNVNEETIYAVKMGNGSSDLSYVVSQSEAALEIYKNDILSEKTKELPIKNVGIWIVLKRSRQLSTSSGKINLNELDMFILKNRLDEWKKKVRLLGLNPIIRLNYIVD